MFKLKALATGIGSLPYKDAESALSLIFKYLPNLPFWPQLPKRDVREGMIAQFAENLPCLKITRDGVYFDSGNKDANLELFYERVIANDSDYFKISEDFALGLYAFYRRLEAESLKNIEFIKCQITGPFTFAAAIKNECGFSLLHDPIFMQAIIKGLTMKALWQVNLFKKFNKKIILFIDEPYLGCFGSAYTPINRNDVVKGLMELTASLKSKDILLGIHCCGNTDWSIFTEAPGIDIISFDAFEFLDKFILYADNIGSFLKRGGILSWGIVPTQIFSDEDTADLLAEKIKEGIEILVKKGVEEKTLQEKLLITPSCGLGTLNAEKSEKIFKLLSQTSAKLKKLL